MIGIDTNILIYARVADSPWYNQASAFLDGLRDNSNVVIAELVLVEYYLALRNPAVLSPALGAAAATAECQSLRKHPRWALEPVLKLQGVLRRGILAGAKAAGAEHPRWGL